MKDLSQATDRDGCREGVRDRGGEGKIGERELNNYVSDLEKSKFLKLLASENLFRFRVP